MADETKIGTPWRDEELDAIVADYFDMLAADISGQPYVKLRHGQALMARIGRTHRSVEFKHQNISAVLDELGMPWIPRYKPKRNYQQKIFGAIDRYLTKHPAVLEPVSTASMFEHPLAEVFVPPPVLTPADEPMAEPLRRLIRKFDPVERDHRNRSLGKAGEGFVVDVERRNLTEASRLESSERHPQSRRRNAVPHQGRLPDLIHNRGETVAGLFEASNVPTAVFTHLILVTVFKSCFAQRLPERKPSMVRRAQFYFREMESHAAESARRMPPRL